MKLVLFISLLGCALLDPASAQASSNMSVFSHLTYPIGTTADVWANGDRLYVARRGEGLAVLDMANPSAPTTIYSGRQELFIQDVKVRGNLLACSNESGNGIGVYLFDISNPANPVEVGNFGGALMYTCNNVAFYGNYLYCVSVTSYQVIVLDITVPANPQLVGTIPSQAVASLLHDVAVVGNRLYISWLVGGFEIYDLSVNPATPSLVAWKLVPTSFVHNTWPLGDGIHVATTDEVSGGYLTIWNISNPLNVTAVGQWRASPLAVMHNLLIQDDFAFITNYTEGLRVVSLRNPAAPAEVAFYDTFNGVNALTFGAWGVYPFDRNRVAVADFSNGLWLFDFKPMTASIVADQPSYVWGETINLTLGGANTTTQILPLHVDLSFSISQFGPATSSLLGLTLDMPPLTGQVPYSIPLPSPGPTGPFTINFILSLTTPSNGILYDAATTTVTLN